MALKRLCETERLHGDDLVYQARLDVQEILGSEEATLEIIPERRSINDLGRGTENPPPWLAQPLALGMDAMPMTGDAGVTKSIIVLAAPKLFKAEYGVWFSMNKRCADKTNKDYGGRGISVCEEWQNSFFRWYLAMDCPRPVGMSIDRIDNDGNYEPSNCKWSSPKEQAWNQRRIYATKLCQLPGCGKAYFRSGLCEEHHNAWREGGVEALKNP
jgi:hypothetical protein